MIARTRTAVARLILALLITAPMLVPASVADAAPARPKLPTAQKVEPVPGKNFTPAPLVDPSAGATLRHPRSVTWPAKCAGRS